MNWSADTQPVLQLFPEAKSDGEQPLMSALYTFKQLDGRSDSSMVSALDLKSLRVTASVATGSAKSATFSRRSIAKEQGYARQTSGE